MNYSGLVSKATLATHLSDINELACGYFINRQAWWNGSVRAMFTGKVRLVKPVLGPGAIREQVERGRAMGQTVRYHVLDHHRTSVTGIQWTARDLTTGHPADLLLTLGTGGRLGVSCKSRLIGKEGAGLKNPGLSVVSRYLGVDLQANVDAAVARACAQWSLPDNALERKTYLRAHPELRATTVADGIAVLQGIRDTILHGFPVERIEEFLMTECLTARVQPPYIRVVGYKTADGHYHAKIVDPYRVDLRGPYRLQPVGRDGVGFVAHGAHVCIVRVKWESEKLASTVKFSVDEWS